MSRACLWPWAPGIKKGARMMGLDMTVFDIAPTILHIYGIPAPVQMRGRVLTEIFEDTKESRAREPHTN
jgi:predicted AlkP superfamily phosphohydrolase/phosphomutase